MNTTAVTSPDEKLGVGLHEVLSHPDLDTIRQEAVRMCLEGLDIAEDVIPSSAIQASRVVPQLVQDLIHLENSWEGLDQDSRPDASLRNPHPLLCPLEHTVPYLSFPDKQPN